jgi:oligopeptide transport system permease protein
MFFANQAYIKNKGGVELGRYLAGRLVSMAIAVFLIITITFFLMHALPSGPFSSDRPLPESVIEALNEKYHLDDSLWEQYSDYLKGVMTFDLGPSFRKTGVSVNQIIKESFPTSAAIGGASIAVVMLLGIPMGVLSAVKKNSWQDHAVMFIATLGITVPSFIVATAFIYVFSSTLGWFPSFGLGSWKHMVGPVIALSGFSLAFVSRLTRSSMIEALGQDYIRTARAKGLSRTSILYKHALKNALAPVVSYAAPMAATILTGSFVVERIFAISGMGKYFVESVGNRDYTVIMGATIFYAVLLISMTLLTDMIHAIMDPRIKLNEWGHGHD